MVAVSASGQSRCQAARQGASCATAALHVRHTLQARRRQMLAGAAAVAGAARWRHLQQRRGSRAELMRATHSHPHCITMGPPAATKPATLLAWDFDWSLVEENSDTFEAARQLGRTQADVEAALHATPLHSALADLLHACLAAVGNQAVDIVVLSDANTVYIDTILSYRGLRHLVREVHTNPAGWDASGTLRVQPYHASPHGCSHRCPANLCKGKVLQEYLGRRRAEGQQYSRVLYVGDGRNDFCPAQLLLHGSASADEAVAGVEAGGSGAAAGAGSSAAAAGEGEGGAKAGIGGSAAAAVGGGSEAAAGAGGSEAEPGSLAPCGGPANRIFAREQYPDGTACSLWVMLCTQAGTEGTLTGDGRPGNAAPASGDGGTPVGTAEQQQQRVVPWRTPQQLAALLRQELGLAA
ncbi:putative phosphatase phospho2 [Chlorella vulgaris]